MLLMQAKNKEPEIYLKPNHSLEVIFLKLRDVQTLHETNEGMGEL